MINLFQLNDLNIKSFLKVILAIQLAMLGVIGADAIGLQIPIIRQLISFIYLIFVPGIVILRILKLHKLGNIETLLYTVGLSIATLMFTGLFMNTVYPLIGISGPISITTLIITISVIVLILCILSYVRDKDFSAPNYIDIKEVLSPPVLFLCLVPFLSIFGTYLVNFHHNNILLMFLIIIIALIVVSIAFNKFIPKNLYPLAVFVIALSLLFYRTLISMYISGFDIHYEYYVVNLVKTNGIWDSTIPEGLNAMLSLVMLAPISSNICGMSLTWVFKIIYPLLFSLVPLGLYRVFQKQTDDKIAFLACFFFVSLNHFYTSMPVLLRQQIAALFLVVLILLMIDKKMGKIKRSFLFIVFGVSLVVSHYGLSYIYMFCIISAWLLLILAENPEMQKLTRNFHSKFGRYKSEKLAGNPISLNARDRTISSTFVLLFITFALTWYMYVSSSTVFDSLIHLGDHITSSISTDFLTPEVSRVQRFLVPQTPLERLLRVVNIIINYLKQIFIITGVLVVLLKHRELKFEKEYVAFSMLNLVIYSVCIAPPFLSPLLAASGTDLGRLSLITFIFLAPFCVIGGLTVFRMISRVVKASWKAVQQFKIRRKRKIHRALNPKRSKIFSAKSNYGNAPWTNETMRKWLKVLSVYFVIFFLFQTGFVREVTQDYTGSPSLNQEWVEKYGDTEKKAGLYSAVTPEQEVFSARWLSMNMNPGEKVYATYMDARVHALTSYGMIPIKDVPKLTNTTKTIQKDAYVYLQYLNVVEGIGTEFKQSLRDDEGRYSYYNMTEISHLFAGENKIYSNGGSEVYK